MCLTDTDLMRLRGFHFVNSPPHPGFAQTTCLPSLTEASKSPVSPVYLHPHFRQYSSERLDIFVRGRNAFGRLVHNAFGQGFVRRCE